MNTGLDTLADDVLGAAVDYLPDDAPASILAVELDRQPSIGLPVTVNGGAPRYVARVPAPSDRADLLRAADSILETLGATGQSLFA